MTRRGRRAAAFLSAALTVVLLAGCTDSGSDDPKAPASDAADALHLAPDCPSPPDDHPTATVDALNKLVASIDLPAWQAGDIGASARLTDGRLVWIFGDTVRPDLQPPIVANSMLVTSGTCIAQLLDPTNGPVIPDVSASVVRWPMSVAVGREDGHDVVMVLCSRIDRGDTGAYGFTFLGTSAAVFTVEPGEAPQLQKVVDLTPDSPNQQQVNWGSAATVHGGWYSVYGTRLTGQQLDFGRELYVGRAPVADPGARKGWQFWDGKRWQFDVRRAAVILPSHGGVSQVLSIDRVGKEFVAVSKRDGDISDFVYKWTAPKPSGPWTPVEELKAPGGFDTGNLKYAPLAHPEIPLASGDLLVSISRNTTDLDRLLSDPQVGRPEFVALPR